MITPKPKEARILKRIADQIVTDSLKENLKDPAIKAGDENHLKDVGDLLSEASVDNISSTMLDAIRTHELEITKAVSFQSELVRMSELRKLGVLRPNWLLNNKSTAYRFVDQLGVARPETISEKVPWEQLRINFPTVIKPAQGAGGRGCYLVYGPDRIVHIKDGRVFGSMEDFESHAARLMDPAQKGKHVSNSWISEKLILEDHQNLVPGRDLKFYCFYGEVLFILEIIRTPTTAWRFILPDNTPIKPHMLPIPSFDGHGVSKEHLDVAAQVSRAIPFPFMRIDFLKGEHQLYFGELTPRPGDFHLFHPDWDRRMGEAWARAESRLLVDLLEGKAFDAFGTATSSFKKSAAPRQRLGWGLGRKKKRLH